MGVYRCPSFKTCAFIAPLHNACYVAMLLNTTLAGSSDSVAMKFLDSTRFEA